LIVPTFSSRIVGETRLIEVPPLEVREKERPIADDRTADAAAGLLLAHRQGLPDQGIRGVEVVVAEVAVQIAAVPVRAALRDDVEVAAKRAAELRLSARRHHLELIHRVHAVRNPAQRRRIVVRRQAVDDEVVGEVAAGC
jgi:hypothetical protein